MNKFSKYIGLDAHKETIAVSVAEASGGEVRYLGEIAKLLPAMLRACLEKTGAQLDNLLRAEKLGWIESSLDRTSRTQKPADA